MNNKLILSAIVGIVIVIGVGCYLNFITISQAFVIFLTLIAILYYYQDWSSPKTELFKKSNFLKNWSEFTFGITLKNTGHTEAVFRVRVWIDGRNPISGKGEKISEDFLNSLFATIPLPTTEGVYPKRSRVARDDFRSFKNIPPRGGVQKEDLRKIDDYHMKTTGNFPTNDFMKLPVKEGKHHVVFKLQQTGEYFIFGYESNGREINKKTLSFFMKVGGKGIGDRLKKICYVFDKEKLGIENLPSLPE